MALAYIQPIFITPAAAGGYIRVFLAGSTDDAPVYNPVTGEVSYSPVPINSAGFSDGFQVVSDNVYDLKVYKANGSLYLTRENVSVLGGSSGAVGPQGPQGVQGPAGATGATGATGAAGTNGTNGTDGEDGTDGVSLVSIRVDETTNTGKILYNLSSDPNNWIDAGDIVPAGLGQVKVTGTDSLGFLEEKVVAGTDVSIDNSGTQLTINNTAPETYKTQASQYSTVKDFLNTIIEGTSGITVTTSADFNKIILSGAGIGGSGFTPKGEWVSGTTYNEGDGVWYYDSGQTPVINRYYVATTTTATNPYTDGTGWVVMFSIDQLGDQMVKLDNSDSTTGFLLNKIKAGDGIVFTRTVDAGGDYITVSGQQVFSVTTTNGTYTIDGLGNEIKFRDGMWTKPVYIGTEISLEHKSIAQMEGQTTPMFTATGLPKFDDYGHYMNASDPIEIGDVAGLSAAITAAGNGKVAVENGDTINYLDTKIIAGENVTITKVPHLTGEALEVAVDLPTLDDDYPIVAEYGNPSSIYFPSNNTGSAILRIAGKSSEFALNTKRIDNRVGGGSFNTSTGIFAPQKDGYYVCTFNAFVHPSTSTSKDSAFFVSCEVETSYDGVTWVGMGSDSAKGIVIDYPSHATYPNGYGKPIAFHMVVDMKDNAYSGAHRMARIIIQQNSIYSGYNNSCYFQYPQFAWYELKRPIGLQGPKGDKGDPGSTTLDGLTDVDVSGATTGQVLGYNGTLWVPVTGGGGGGGGTTGESTIDGLLTFPIILSNTNISTGHTSDQGATYASSRVIAAAGVEANFMSCFFTQVGTFYGLRMGIYTPGPAGDTLIAQTEVRTMTPALGICTMPLTRDGNGNPLTETLYLDPNTSYMPAIIIKANATNLAAYEGISTNPPNHFGRYDSWNAPAPTNLMPATASFSQSNTFPWLAISK